jgi:hypothetical protein
MKGHNMVFWLLRDRDGDSQLPAGSIFSSVTYRRFFRPIIKPVLRSLPLEEYES